MQFLTQFANGNFGRFEFALDVIFLITQILDELDITMKFCLVTFISFYIEAPMSS